MQHDAWFFIGIFVFIFVIWIATGGPLRPPAISAPTLPSLGLSTTAVVAGGGGSVQLPRAPYTIGSQNVYLSGSSNSVTYGGSYGGGTGALAPSLYGIPFGPTSPYRSIVSMSNYVSNASSSNPNSEYVQIAVGVNAGTFVNITNWKLVSETTGKAAVIPGGTTVPTSGIVNPTQDIVLAPGEHAVIVSGRSPIGMSFRENKCIGYFSTFQQFSPSLPQNCPLPSDELVALYGDFYVRDAKCLEYVRSLSRCQTVLFPQKDISRACKNFVLQYLNYNGCVTAHKNDPDFEGNTWHIYLGLLKHMWRSQYEVVKLRDSTGKTVDAFSY